MSIVLNVIPIHQLSFKLTLHFGTRWVKPDLILVT